MNICMDCAYSKRLGDALDGPPFNVQCLAPKVSVLRRTICPVTGEVSEERVPVGGQRFIECLQQRQMTGSDCCGPSGRFFKPKESA